MIEILNGQCLSRYLMVKAYIPKLEDLWFRESMMADPETMSYNAAYGGTIPFPKEQWERWYDQWVENAGTDRYYRYVLNEQGSFVGEIAYHLDQKRQIYLADVIIHASVRGKGYGKEALELLCEAARANGIEELYDDIASDNPSWKMCLRHGFVIDWQDETTAMVKKRL